MTHPLRPLLITQGDACGIGPEIIVRCWQRQAPRAGVIERALEPLLGRGVERHGRQAHHEARQARGPLAAHGVALVRHGARAHLVLLEGFLHLAQVREQAKVVGALVDGAGGQRERVQHHRVEAAGIGLATDGPGAVLGPAEPLAHAALERVHLRNGRQPAGFPGCGGVFLGEPFLFLPGASVRLPMVLESVVKHRAERGVGPVRLPAAAALGVKMAQRDRAVVALIGDGGFGANPSVLATAMEANLPVIFLVMDNACFGTIAGLENTKQYQVTVEATNPLGTSPASSPVVQTVYGPVGFTGPLAFTILANAEALITIGTSGSPQVSTIAISGALPQGLHFASGGNGEATISGRTALKGSFRVTLTARNGYGSAVSKSFNIFVVTSMSLRQPVILTVGVPAEQQVSFTTPLAYFNGAITFTGLPSWASLSIGPDGQGVLTGTPPVGSGGLYQIGLSGTEFSQVTASTTFQIGVNETPKFTSNSLITVMHGLSFSFAVSTSGGCASPIRIKREKLTQGVLLSDNRNGTANLVGQVRKAGSYALSLTANCGSLSSQQIITLNVT